jgi:16S rRNA (guanine(966)-N(2))-methyltransferase RsmD
MRIIAGALGGRRLVAPRGLGTRPTADKVKEAVFSILGPPDAHPFHVLDLYAGSGALGLEALSRGADRAILVENDRAALTALERNVEALDLEGRARVVRVEAGLVLRKPGLDGPFGWIFLDPPYGTGELDRALRLLRDGKLLTPTGVLVAQHDAKDAPVESVGRLALADRRRWGSTTVSFYHLLDEDRP